MTTPQERRQALADILEQRVLVLDGAMGTLFRGLLAPILGRDAQRFVLGCPRREGRHQSVAHRGHR